MHYYNHCMCAEVWRLLSAAKYIKMKILECTDKYLITSTSQGKNKEIICDFILLKNIQVEHLVIYSFFKCIFVI